MPPFDLPGNKTQSGRANAQHARAATPRQLQRDPLRGQEGIRAALHPRREEPGHLGRERRDALGGARSHRRRSATTRPLKVGVDRTENVGNNEKITIGANRTENVGANENITIGAAAPRASGRRDHHHRRQPQRHGGRERDQDGRGAAHAHGGHQRNHHRRRRAGNHHRRAAGGDGGCGADHQRRRQSVDRRRRPNQSINVGANLSTQRQSRQDETRYDRRRAHHQHRQG